MLSRNQEAKYFVIRSFKFHVYSIVICFPNYPSNFKILVIIMVVLIRNGGGHCNNDVVSPAI